MNTNSERKMLQALSDEDLAQAQLFLEKSIKRRSSRYIS